LFALCTKDTTHVLPSSVEAASVLDSAGQVSVLHCLNLCSFSPKREDAGPQQGEEGHAGPDLWLLFIVQDERLRWINSLMPLIRFFHREIKLQLVVVVASDVSVC
jgi:hypothetical protein